MEFLIVIEPASGGRYEHRVAPGSYVLGREEASCDIAILSPEVSRQHARIHLSADQCTVEDLGSTAGTSKDGQTLEGKQSFSFPTEVMLGTTKLAISVDEAVEMTFDSGAVGSPTASPGSGITFNQGASEAPLPQSEAGHYTKGREIARGGMGAILQANDRMLGRTVAMKVVLEERASEDARMRFIREATVLGQLEHPNIIPIHELGKDGDGNFFYAMKMVEGRTLQAIINDLKKGDRKTIEEFTLDRLLTVFRKVCDAIAFAHSKGIVHRDLKPENVMVGAFGEVLVMDWGLAKILNDAAQTTDELEQQHRLLQESTVNVSESALPSGFQELTDSQMQRGSQDLTMAGAVMGSPQYMPPEQAEGRIADIDERSDIYSLGGILYAILTLRPPIAGKTVVQVLENVKTGNIVDPTQHNPGGSAAKGDVPEAADPSTTSSVLPHCPDGRVPIALSAVAMKAMALEANSRYPAVPKLVEEIENFQSGFATSAENISAFGQLVLFIKRNKAVSIAAAISLLLITALSVGFMIKLNAEKLAALKSESDALEAKKSALGEADRARKAEARAVKEREASRRSAARANLALADAALREGNGPAMQIALDEVPEDLRGSTWNYLLDESDDSIFVFNDIGIASVTGVTPLSTRPGVFVVGRNQNKVGLVDVRTGRSLLSFDPKLPTRYPVGGYRTLAVSPDGERIAIGRVGRDGIAIHSARDGSKLVAWDSPGADSLEFSPDGRQLLQVARSDGFQLRDSANGQLRWRNDSRAGGVFGAIFTPDGRHLVTANRMGLQLVKVGDGELVATLLDRKLESLYGFSISPDGKTVLLSLPKSVILAVSVPDGQVVLDFQEQTDCRHVEFTPDGAGFVTVVRQKDGVQGIRVRELKKGKLLHTLLGGLGQTAGASVHPLSGELVVGGQRARAWGMLGEPPKWSISGIGSAIAFWGTDDLVFTSIGQSKCRLVDLSADSPRMLWQSPDRNTRDVSVSADGRLAAVIARDVLVLQNLNGKIEQVTSFKRTPKRGYARNPEMVRMSPTGDRLAFREKGASSIEILPIDDNASTIRIETKGIHVFRDMQWLGEGKIVAIGTGLDPRGASNSEEWIMAWDALTGDQLQTITNSLAIDALAVAPDGRRFAEAGADKMVRIRDASTWEVVQEFRAHNAGITALAWHPIRPILSTASEDLSIKLWNLDSGEQLDEFRGLPVAPGKLAFSPTGRRIGSAKGADDKHARIWEPASLQDQPDPTP